MIQESFEVLERLQEAHGLFRASTSNDYGYVWPRDSAYMALPYMDKSCGTFERICHGLFDLFHAHEGKIKIHTKRRPRLWFEFIHSRYSADLKEIPDHEWGHAQHDAIGIFLYIVGEGHKRGRAVIRDKRDLNMLQMLVDYLICCEFWHDTDHGMWEEYKEVHMSSVGAVLGGMQSVWGLVYVPWKYVAKGLETLIKLGTRESETKDVDLAQLSLIYPYDLFSESVARTIVENVEKRLLRARGVARYVGDSYYSTLEQQHGRGRSRSFYEGTEAEWTFGLPWLALCHLKLGDRDKARTYIEWTERVMTLPGVLPELYFAGEDRYNVNTPLGWASAMYIVAKEAYEKETSYVGVG